jgi:hypothetical protein
MRRRLPPAANHPRADFSWGIMHAMVSRPAALTNGYKVLKPWEPKQLLLRGDEAIEKCSIRIRASHQRCYNCCEIKGTV